MYFNKGNIEMPWGNAPEAGGFIEISQGFYWIRMPLHIKPNHVNVYAIDDGFGWTVIDTGLGTKKTKKIWYEMLNGPLAGKNITRVILTHHHPDHVGLAGWFKTEFGSEIWATRTAWLMARMLCFDRQKAPLPETVSFWRSAGIDPHILSDCVRGNPFNFSDVVEHIPLGYKRIQQGDVIEIGNDKWMVHIGNGHAPEHATLWNEKGQFVIAGDQVISSISPNLGVYATEPDADPVGEWIQSCERFLSFGKSTHLVLSGHKLPFTGLPFRLNQLVENHQSCLSRLRAFLTIPRSACDCFQPLFKKKIGKDEYILALGEAVAHLNHLYKIGSVVRVIDCQGVYRYTVS